MKKLLILITAIFFAGLVWWLTSPLFIDQVVEEDFPMSAEPTKIKEEEEIKVMTDEEISQKIDEIMEAHELSEEKIEAMTEVEKVEMEKEVISEMATLPQKMIVEEFDHGSLEPFIGDAHPFLFRQGNFVDADSFHKGTGEASIYSRIDSSFLLRFENVSFTNGPDLRVYLTREMNPTREQVKNGFEVAELKGNQGSHNYPLPDDFDPTDYKAVVIYCKPFGVIFSVANLN